MGQSRASRVGSRSHPCRSRTRSRSHDASRATAIAWCSQPPHPHERRRAMTSPSPLNLTTWNAHPLSSLLNAHPPMSLLNAHPLLPLRSKWTTIGMQWNYTAMPNAHPTPPLRNAAQPCRAECRRPQRPPPPLRRTHRAGGGNVWRIHLEEKVACMHASHMRADACSSPAETRPLARVRGRGANGRVLLISSLTRFAKRGHATASLPSHMGGGRRRTHALASMACIAARALAVLRCASTNAPTIRGHRHPPRLPRSLHSTLHACTTHRSSQPDMRVCMPSCVRHACMQQCTHQLRISHECTLNPPDACSALACASRLLTQAWTKGRKDQHRPHSPNRCRPRPPRRTRLPRHPRRS